MSTPTMDDHALSTGRVFVWHEVYGPSVEAAVEFYTKALDFGVEKFEMGPDRTYTMLSKDGKSVAGIVSTKELEHPDVPPHWATYIAVDDVDARLRKCTDLGATVVVAPMDVPTVGRMALIADPQGAHVWLFKSSPG